MKRLALTLAFLVCVTGVVGASEQAARQLIPAVASTPGLAGSSWQTELSIHNPSPVPAEVVIELIPTGYTGGLANPEYAVLSEPLQPGQTLVFDDVLGEFFSDHDTGALVVVGRHPTEGPVPLVVSSRTWTTEIDGGGTLGQGIGGIPWAGGDLMVDEWVLPGLESTESFRTNLGLVNPTWIYSMTLQVEVFDPAGESVGIAYYSLDPRAHVQINRFLDRLDLAGSGYTAVVRVVNWSDITPMLDGIPTNDPPQLDVVAYASRVDNLTNDPLYIRAETRVERWGPPRHRVIQAAANTAGVGGTQWTTDVSIFFPGPQPISATYAELIPTGGQGIGSSPPDRANLRVGNHETLTVNNFLEEHFPDDDVASLVFSSLAVTAGVGELMVNSRTWTEYGGEGGTMGQGIPGYSRAEAADPVVVANLESTDRFRTNLGLVNLSQNVRTTFEVKILHPTGSEAGLLSYTLEPWSHIQVNGILEDLQLEGSGFTAVVSIAESENTFQRFSESWNPSFQAYGSKVDNVTGDPTFLEGVRLTPDSSGEQGDWYDFNWDEPWYRCPSEPIADGATVVRAFDQDYHWFGEENHRSITREVDFPETGDWNQVGLRFHLECPENGLCDHWDRTGSLQMVLNPDDPEEDWEYLEIMRHITPYRLEMCQYVDITALAPLLRDRQTLVSWIDTWVGPGHSNGEGWRVTWDFVFYPGEDRTPDEVINIWGRRSITVGYLEPDRNVDSQIDPVDVTIPSDATRVEARLITTGHSFGNTDNCAEFCVLRQDLYVNGEMRSVIPWRTDCEHNAVYGQAGTWLYDRNGWCPGAITVGQTIDITDLIDAGTTNVIDFDIREPDGTEYENTNVTTDPIEWISLQLYVYRD